MSEEIKDIDELEGEESEGENTEERSPDSAEKEKKDENRVVVFEEAVEAILFAAGHPISYATLARVFDMTPGKIKDKIFEYSLRYNDPAIPRGVILLTYKDSCQLSTKQYYLNEIRDALGIKKSGSLSTSSMEALAIIAYNQPVTRIFVDTLRRADSSYAMNNLLDRGLIEPKGRLDAPGRPMLYGTTSDFLRVFGLKDIESLPRTTDEMKEIFAKTRNVEVSEGAVQEEMEIAEDGTVTVKEETSSFDDISLEDIPDNTDDAFDESDSVDESMLDEDGDDGADEDEANMSVVDTDTDDADISDDSEVGVEDDVEKDVEEGVEDENTLPLTDESQESVDDGSDGLYQKETESESADEKETDTSDNSYVSNESESEIISDEDTAKEAKNNTADEFEDFEL